MGQHHEGEWVANQGLVIRLGALNTGLDRALKLYDSAASAPDRRAAVEVALNTVIDFIRSFHPKYDPSICAPLVDLMAALMDLDRGNQQDLLTPTKIFHRPPEALPREHLKAYAAATLDRLISGGEKKQDAADKIARILVRRGYRLDGNRGAPTGGSVIDWRDRYTGHSGREVGPAAFRQLRAALHEIPPKDAMNRLDRFATRVIPKNPPS